MNTVKLESNRKLWRESEMTNYKMTIKTNKTGHAIMKNLTAIALILTVFLLPGNFVQAQKTADSKLKEVDVYFYFIGTEGIEDEILPLKRSVSAAAPLRPAIEEMLREPTADEKKLGYESLNYDKLKLVSVKLKKGTARVDFSRVVGENTNPGDLFTLNFESAVKKTAMQFPSVKKVVVCVNGMNEFGIGMVIDAPLPCPKEK